MNDVKNLIERLDENRKQHEEEMCYLQALKNGCEERFLRCFDGRMELYPLEQTKAFLELLKTKHLDTTEQKLKQWLVWLKTLVKEKPTHKDVNIWEKSIKLIENTLQ